MAAGQKKGWASMGLYLYWVEGAERARMHPGRYGHLSSHSLYTSWPFAKLFETIRLRIWSGLRFAPEVLQWGAELGDHEF